ncbi:MAG: response regulator [Pseudomonadota bacterium]
MEQVSAPDAAKTILIVDDDADIRAVLSEFLESEGYTIATAANGSDALAYLHQHPRTSVILLDLMMPVMNGYQFIAAQRLDALVSAIPVVVMTARGAIEPGLVGVTRVLPKPMDLDDLLESLVTAEPPSAAWA